VISAALLILLTAAFAPSTGSFVPETTPVPAARGAADVNRLVDEGVTLHDRKDYDGAIEKYRRALEIEPTDGRALYELAYSLWSKNDLKAALEAAERAAHTSYAEGRVATMLGSIYDDLGEPQRAIAAYRSGIDRDPNFLLYFNLGTTYERLQRLDLARIAFENAVALQPRHPSSHLYLARVYKKQGYQIPAVMAATRFLTLESDTARSGGVVVWIDELFTRGVKVTGPDSTNVTVNMDGPKDEGDFTAADVMLGMVQASKNLKEIEMEGSFDMHRLKTLLSVVSETPEGKGFAMEYYVPFYKEVAGRKAGSALAAAALRGMKSKEIDTWIAGHPKEMAEFAGIEKSFPWSSSRPQLPEDPPPAAGAQPEK